MRSLFRKVAGFFHRHPGIKSTAVAVAGTAATMAAGGSFGPRAAAVAGGVAALAGLWTKRPKDATVADREPAE